jgi:hypothetical protein
MRLAILIIGLLTVFTFTSASAQLNGLERFERDIKAKFDQTGATMTYKESSALGASGFVLGGVVISAPAGPDPAAKPDKIAIERLTVEDLDFDRVAADKVPAFVRLRAEGIKAVTEAADSQLALMMKSYDLPNVPFGLVIDYRHDSGRKVFTLTRLELTMPGLARFEFGMTVDGVASLDPPKDEQAKAAAAAAVALRTASLTYDDASLLSRILTAAARNIGAQPEALVGQAVGTLGGLSAGQPAEAQAVFDSLVSFVQDWRKPVGPIRVSVNPPGKIGMADAQKMMAANAIKDVFGLSVNYAGTRAGAAAKVAPPPPAAQPAPQTSTTQPPAPAPAPAPVTPVEVSCEANTRLFFLQDGVWWPATVRGPASGGECTLRVDGEQEDDVFALVPGETVPWSIDGPGTPATACRRGDLVLVHYKGTWYTGQVKADAPEGQDCPVKYDADYDDELVPMDIIRLQ